MVTEEYVMICIDTSYDMESLNPCRYQFQLECARSYCQAKLKSNNQKSAIGIMTMGACAGANVLNPTSDLDKVMHHLELPWFLGGCLDIIRSIHISLMVLRRYDAPSKRKRILLFTGGGPVGIRDIKVAELMGKILKDDNVAVDVVDFYMEGCFEDSKEMLKVFVAAANNSNNSNIVQLQAEKFLNHYEIMSSAKTIFPDAALLKEGEMPKGKEIQAATQI
ncbi:26S proteasome non-ATPase regulatory subunit 4 homolog [Rutidosis leptorrhynchoides]|uniref:26S proteasome non-ATPase regulatory subunit 4 homolog n=1 Tax=Rutidosis leptorrhynchoides TaxID=125765 RepID=UPI003A9A12FC